jgi:Lon protease-like protein
MTQYDENTDLPADFSGRVRLFPLPNLVMFPHAIQPLHVFEPRYVEMLEDAMQKDQLLAMALLKPGWESEYDARPAVFPATCIGRIVAQTRLPDGTHNLVLRGLCRAAIEHELPPEHAYRMADVTVMNEQSPTSLEQQTELRQTLTRRFERQLSDMASGQEQLAQLLDVRLPVGILTDVIAFSLDLATLQKQEFLSEPDAGVRAQRLIEILDQVADLRLQGEEPGPTFPPRFSDN